LTCCPCCLFCDMWIHTYIQSESDEGYVTVEFKLHKNVSLIYFYSQVQSIPDLFNYEGMFGLIKLINPKLFFLLKWLANKRNWAVVHSSVTENVGLSIWFYEWIVELFWQCGIFFYNLFSLSSQWHQGQSTSIGRLTWPIKQM